MGSSKSKIIIVPYETIHGKICITPCMRKLNLDGERPFIGSLKCEMCSCFVSKDKNRQKVACNFSECTNATYRRKQSVKKTLSRLEKEKMRDT